MATAAAGLNPEFTVIEQKNIISRLVSQGRKSHGFANPTVEQQILLHRLDLFLTRLDNNVKMTPAFQKKTKIDRGMQQIYNNPDVQFPEKVADRAKGLYDKWKTQNWGAPLVKQQENAGRSASDVKRESKDEQTEDVRPGPKRRRTSTQPSTSLVVDDGSKDERHFYLPPKDHPIWGEHGIMHGLCLQKSAGRKDNVSDPRYAHEKRDARVYGHNGLHVGDWFPQLKIALFRGAHGHAQAGISGNQIDGAYSVLVSGTYEALDKDEGDRLYYSGSGSMKNEDPNNPPPSTPGTLALHASLASRKPVRVIRTSSGRGQYRPSYGFRYDGLYRVVAVVHSKNQLGGRIEQFKLERTDGQIPIDRYRPNPTEIRQYEQIADGFPKARSVRG